MNTNERLRNSRGRIRWSAEDRKELMAEQAKSGLTKKAFCLERDINLGTFHGWCKSARQKRKKSVTKRKPKFQEINMPLGAVCPVEIILPGGARVCLRGSSSDELLKLIRGIIAC